MEYKITAHRDINSLEFRLLKELPKFRALYSSITDDEIQKKTSFIEWCCY